MIEIGPLFRLAAHIHLETCGSGHLRFRDLLRGAVTLDPSCNGFGSATNWRMNDDGFDDRLWRPEVEQMLPTVARDPLYEHLVLLLVKSRVAASSNLIVVGHRASRSIRDFDFAIHLSAEPELRHERKRAQFGYALTPRSHYLRHDHRSRSRSRRLELDTTGKSLAQTLALLTAQTSAGAASFCFPFAVGEQAGGANSDRYLLHA